MQTQVTGTFTGDLVGLDSAINIPDNSRVSLQIKSLEKKEDSVDPKTAWDRIKSQLSESPIHSGSLKYTRDELHEREA